MSGAESTSPWRNRDFAILWSGQAISLLGESITVLALPLIAIAVLDSSTFGISLLAAAASLPWLIVSLPAGVIVDRVRRRTVMLCCNIGRGAILLTVPLAVFADVVSIWQLCVVACLSGCLNVFFSSAYLSYPATLLRKEQLVSASSMVVTATSFASLAGPGVAGLLIGRFGAGRAILVDVFSYLVSSVSLLFIRHRQPRPQRPHGANRSFRREMAGGLRLVVADRILVMITASNALGNFLLAAINAILLPYAVRELNWSVQTVGLILGIGAGGGLAGSLCATNLIKRYGMVRVLLFSQLFFAPGQVTLALVAPGLSGQIIAAVGLCLTLASAIIYNVAQRSYRVISCPPDDLGKMNATVSWLQAGLRPIAALVGGLLGTVLGLRPTILVLACLLPIGIVMLWLSPLRSQYRSERAAATA
ncbi:MFS transporter [Kribbella sp. NPDC051718]|uniref:MFS transporter n=1 Tax=Kribbella sp. NPDC051718 TaxID=3155168 RepID=UPI0034195427